MKNLRDFKLRISGIVFIACSIVPYICLPTVAFPSEYTMHWIVTFSMILNWRYYPFSIQTIVGWCYFLSLIISIILLVTGTLLVIKKSKHVLDEKLPLLIIGSAISAFLLFSVITKIVLLAKGGLYPTLEFLFYIFTELLTIITMAFVLITLQRKKQSLQVKRKNI